MIPRDCKRLAEVDFPIAVVSKHAAREKSIRHGHPSTLHLWWARRPLASCRAMLLALLLPDPCDAHCPDAFKTTARDILRATPGRVGTSDAELRQALLDFIGDFANWDHAANPTFLEVGRGLVKAAHPEETPLVVDPFAGGGSIPLEALRLGCDAFASDLNPVACLILKTMLEDIPRHGPGLADELRRVGAEIKAAAEKELGQFYPPDPDGARPIAYLWARTVRCEAPNCGAEIPLARSFWLCKKAGRLRALRYRVVRPSPGAACHSPPEGRHIQLPSPNGRGVGGEGAKDERHHGPLVLPAGILDFARALRREQTDAETRLWSLLRDRRLGGWKFRRQHPIPPYIVDFYCDEARLAVELDGSQHAETEERDDRRTRFLEIRGLRVLRFWNNQVLGETEAVLQAIWNALHEPSPGAARHPLPGGEGTDHPSPSGKYEDILPSPSGRGVGGEGVQTPYLAFDIFTPKSAAEVPPGTVTRARATCPCCGATLAPDRVRAQLAAQRGGADVKFDNAGRRSGGATMLAVVTLHPGLVGRQYRLPTEDDYAAVWQASQALEKIVEAGSNQPLPPIPNEPLPPIGTLGFRVQRYGMTEWGDLFTARQKLTMQKLTSVVALADVANGIRDLLALAADRTGDQLSSLVRWLPTIEAIASTFGRQALPITWDFCEACPLQDAAANFLGALDWIEKVVEGLSSIRIAADAQLADAAAIPLPDDAAGVCFTDPPYYDAVPYADLSDFFFVWLKRTLPNHPLLHDPFDSGNLLTPKKAEIVQDETKSFNNRAKDRTFFEEAMSRAFTESRRVTSEGGIASVVFAHKTTEGWEALLSGMTKARWVITGSWPLATERNVRLRARDSAALATSIHLVCRPRIEDRIGDWADVLRELPDTVGEWMARLEREGVRGADLVFACIGPALEIFSRYSRVETAEGREVPLAEYLEKVWEVVGRAALHQVLGTEEAQARNGGAGALEEDARLTALFLWTLRSTAGEPAPAQAGAPESEDEGDAAADDPDDEEDGAGKPAKGFTLIYDIVRRFAQPLGIHLDAWEGRIIETKKGVVRLLPVKERAAQLFGAEGAAGLADRIERAPATAAQLELFPQPDEPTPQPRGRRRRFAAATASTPVQATTLDRVHAAMLLQAGGRTNGLRALLAAEQERGPDFGRLADALIALYPQGCDERRLLEAMRLAMPR